MTLSVITLEILDKIDRVRDEIATQIRVVELPEDLAIELRHSLDRQICDCLDLYLGIAAAPPIVPVTPPPNDNGYIPTA